MQCGAVAGFAAAAGSWATGAVRHLRQTRHCPACIRLPTVNPSRRASVNVGTRRRAATVGLELAGRRSRSGWEDRSELCFPAVDPAAFRRAVDELVP
jgi:hypothetical protein